MPGLDGFQVIEKLRSVEGFASIPIIALTASAMMGDRERAMAAGFTGYITKPIRLDALRAEVERLLA
jgi:CheY-like chemotaxis protein